ncbi:hypothetical protein QEZ52_00405 [Aliisedimentitalea scapharcae]|uniref:Uncharacterized protein n=1 Tax=Aliisedimentitalea scapharcae TaxID=1524259 RepID=A0ABZ2XSG7_9RHOB
MNGQPKLHWRSQVRILLLEGLGAEDIAIRLERPVQDVRGEISDLRANGWLGPLCAAARTGAAQLIKQKPNQIAGWAK